MLTRDEMVDVSVSPGRMVGGQVEVMKRGRDR